MIKDKEKVFKEKYSKACVEFAKLELTYFESLEVLSMMQVQLMISMVKDASDDEKPIIKEDLVSFFGSLQEVSRNNFVEILKDL